MDTGHWMIAFNIVGLAAALIWVYRELGEWRKAKSLRSAFYFATALVAALASIGIYFADQEKEARWEDILNKSKAGRLSGYSPTGNLMTIEPGHITYLPTEKKNKYEEMKRLEKAKNYSALLALCREEIARSPEWLTPYLLAGWACMRLEKWEEAERYLEYVVSQQSDEPFYAQAKDWLTKIQARRSHD